MAKSMRIGRMRIGRITVTRDVLLNPKMIMTIQKNMAVLRTEDNVLINSTEMTCIGNMFDEVPDMCVIPSYQIEINESWDGKVKLKFTREEP